MSGLVARLRAEAGNKFEESLERLLDEAANRIEALERALKRVASSRPDPADDKINEAFKRATRC